MTGMRSPFRPGPFTAVDAERIAAALKVLAVPARVHILHLLAKHGPMTSTAMMPHLGLTQPTVSHHLRGLEQAGLISVIDDGPPWRQIEFDAVSDLAGLIDPHRPASRPSMPVHSGAVVRHSGEVSA